MEVPRIRLSYSTQTKNKNGLSSQGQDNIRQKVTLFLNKMKNMKKKVKISCCENVGEIKTIEENCANCFEGIIFEFTSSGTLQKNVAIECGFATLSSWMRVIMDHMGLCENLKTVIWPEYLVTVTKLETMMVNPHEEKCAHEKLCGKVKEITKNT